MLYYNTTSCHFNMLSCMKFMAEFPDPIMQCLEAIGRNIAIFRQRKGMTLQELAEDVGADKSAISKYEAGANPTVVTMLRIATALDVTIVDLVRTDIVLSDNEIDQYAQTKKKRRKSGSSDKED